MNFSWEISKGFKFWLGMILSFALVSISFAAYSALSKVNTSDVLSKDSWNQMVDNLIDHESRIVGLESKSEKTSVFLGTLSNASSIISWNGWFTQFSAIQNNDTAVFQPLSSGNFWVKILKAWKISWHYQQDVIANGGSYIYLQSYIDSTNLFSSLLAPTGGYWNTIFTHGAYEVTAGQVLTFKFVSGGTTIASMDNSPWWTLSISWSGK